MNNELLSLHEDEILTLTDLIGSQGFDFSHVEKELAAIDFSLMDHPDESLDEFNSLYARLQSYSGRITSLILDLRSERHVWMSFKYRAERLFSKLRFNLLSDRKDIKESKNQGLREAIVSKELSPIIELQQIVEQALLDIDFLIKQCEIKKEDLDKANTNMSRQQKIVESLIGLGYRVKRYANEE